MLPSVAGEAFETGYQDGVRGFVQAANGIKALVYRDDSAAIAGGEGKDARCFVVIVKIPRCICDKGTADFVEVTASIFMPGGYAFNGNQTPRVGTGAVHRRKRFAVAQGVVEVQEAAAEQDEGEQVDEHDVCRSSTRVGNGEVGADEVGVARRDDGARGVAVGQFAANFHFAPPAFTGVMDGEVAMGGCGVAVTGGGIGAAAARLGFGQQAVSGADSPVGADVLDVRQAASKRQETHQQEEDAVHEMFARCEITDASHLQRVLRQGYG